MSHSLDLYVSEQVQTLPVEERARALRLHLQFEGVASSGADRRSEALLRVHMSCADLGLSAKRIVALYYEWLRSGRSPHSLARHYRGGGAKVSYPEVFREHLLRLVGTRKRRDARRQAIRALMSAWAAGLSVPGYGTWQELYARSHAGKPVPPIFPEIFPAGWSERSLYRLIGQHDVEIVMDQRGSAAAHDLLPGILRDVGSLRWMEYIVCDDFRPDVECVHLPTRQVVRPEGLLALDLSSREVLGFGLQPRQAREDGTRQGLVREDLRSLLYALFCRHGLPLGYTVTILCENASAAITPEFEAQLVLTFGGRVRVVRTGMTTHRNLLYGFGERHGQPWAKGWIEANFRKLHLEASHLPGQTGPRYDLAPGDRAERVAYTERLLRTAAEWQLPQLRTPLPTFEELYAELEAAFERMALRTDHELQGFAQRVMVRLAPHLPPVPRESLAELPAGTYDLANAEILTRMESPRERSTRLRAAVTIEQVPPWAIRTLALCPKAVTVRGRKIDMVLDGVRRTYTDPGCEALREDGATLTAYYNPQAPTELHLCDKRGNYLATVRELGRVDIRDVEGLRAAQERTARIRGEVHGAVRARHADEDEQLRQMRAHNEAVLQQGTGSAQLLAAVDAARADQESRSAVTSRDVSRAMAKAASAAQSTEAEDARPAPAPATRSTPPVSNEHDWA